MTFWIYCHACGEGTEGDVLATWVFMCRHSPHATTMTRVLLDQADKDILEGATALLEGNQ